MERCGPREVARRDVRRIAELFYRGLDALPRRLLHVSIAAQGTRDGHGRNTGVFRDFVHRHRVTAPSWRSLHYLPQRKPTRNLLDRARPRYGDHWSNRLASVAKALASRFRYRYHHAD